MSWDAAGEAHRKAPWLLGLAGACLALLAMIRTVQSPPGMMDVDQFWQAGSALRAGDGPLRGHRPGRTSPVPLAILLSLPAAVLLAPLGLLPLHVARIAFIGIVAAIFGFVLGRARSWAWPAVLSIPFLTSAVTTQLSPLLAAAMLIPALGWLVADQAEHLGLCCSRSRASQAPGRVGACRRNGAGARESRMSIRHGRPEWLRNGIRCGTFPAAGLPPGRLSSAAWRCFGGGTRMPDCWRRWRWCRRRECGTRRCPFS